MNITKLKQKLLKHSNRPAKYSNFWRLGAANLIAGWRCLAMEVQELRSTAYSYIKLPRGGAENGSMAF
jgi:hypothetical protein